MSHFLYGNQLLKYPTATQDDREVAARYQACLYSTLWGINEIEWHIRRTNKKSQ